MSDEATQERQPGWYDDGTGQQQRWWSGRDWTEHTQPAETPVKRDAAPKQPARHPQADDPDTIWSAVGKTITGIGGGKYRLTADMLYFEHGVLSTNAQQIHTWQIHDVDASQSMTQKARGVGTITLRARRTGGDETVWLADVGDFREGVRLINDAAYQAGQRKRQQEQTQHVNYQGFPPAVQSQAAPAVPSSPQVDLMVELTKLATLKEQGLLSDEEFTAAKRKLLDL